MQLISKGSNGEWQFDDTPLPDWEAAESVLLEVDAEPTSLEINGKNIGINFPAFNDGRGLSLAVLIRTRLGHTGDIYALGAVHQDILHYLARCGFNKILLPTNIDPAEALSLIAPYSEHYQSSVVVEEPSFKRVERGFSA